MTKAQVIGLFEIHHGLSPLPFLLVGESPVGKNLAIVGLELDGLVVILDGPAVLFEIVVGISAVYVCFV